jgi:hypothetical protein
MLAALPNSIVGAPVASAAAAQEVDQKAVPGGSTERRLEPKEVQEHLETEFESDARDPRWTRRDEDVARDKFSAVLPKGSEMRSLECRETMCRIETSHASLEESRQYTQTAFLDQSTQIWNVPGYTMRIGDTSEGAPVVMVAYIAREGHELPTLTP